MTEYLTALDAATRVRAVDEIGVPLGPGQPVAFLHALGERDAWTDLTISGALLVDLFAVLTKPNVRLLSGFFGPAERFLRDSGADVQFVPADFRRFAPIVRMRAPRVMATLVAPPDRDGYVSLSLHAGATVDELHRAGADPDRLLIAEVNAGAPRTHGLPPEHPHRVHLDEVDIVIESDRPLFTLADAEPTPAEAAIARHALEFVADGSTLQTGIGGVPSQVAKLLAEGDGGDYGVHSEMFTTGLMELHKAGKVTNKTKAVYPGVSITTFAAGTAELNAWLDDNDAVAFLPVDIVNAPDVIARNHNFVSINGAIAIDLFGQVIADTIAGQQFSGIGGHEDFVAPSGLDLSDRSLLCLPSTASVDGGTISRISPSLAAGTIVTTPRHQLDIVITEHGVARLRGRTVRERAVALAQVADPRFRDDLLGAADALR
jgi:acyl-CoA hydrolase